MTKIGIYTWFERILGVLKHLHLKKNVRIIPRCCDFVKLDLFFQTTGLFWTHLDARLSQLGHCLIKLCKGNQRFGVANLFIILSILLIRFILLIIIIITIIMKTCKSNLGAFFCCCACVLVVVVHLLLTKFWIIAILSVPKQKISAHPGLGVEAKGSRSHHEEEAWRLLQIAAHFVVSVNIRHLCNKTSWMCDTFMPLNARTEMPIFFLSNYAPPHTVVRQHFIRSWLRFGHFKTEIVT